MIRFSDAAELIEFAQELHQLATLSDKIQRELNEDRAKEISDYFISTEEASSLDDFQIALNIV